ncbi:MAG: polyprenyl synthetase family protein, partial [Thermoplasmata archaeon]
MDLRSELGRRKSLVEGRLREFFEERRGKLDGILREALDALEDLTLRGGKRVRASLVMMGYRAATGEEPGQILDPAAAVELLQSYLLIHDDVMDRSDLRRGGPTVHRMFSERYGDEWLGISLAITVGDLADSYAQQLIAESDFPPENVLAALGV